MALAEDVFRPGDEVPHSGIYRVTHNPAHTEPHEVTCVYGKRFPPCHGCQHSRFVLVRAAMHVGSHDFFRRYDSQLQTFFEKER